MNEPPGTPLMVGFEPQRPRFTTPPPPSVAWFRGLLPFLLLALITLAAFHGVARCAFINFDDDEYVYANRHIRDGLTWEGIRWGLTADFFRDSSACDYWQPVTWLSRMLDVQLFGLNPAGHHLMNLAIHLASTWILFHVMRRMTNALWPSWFVAALFAVHPLHVEAVAWVTARKDLLSGFFWMATIWMYLCHRAAPSPTRYILLLVTFALGLMAKPVGIMLPLVLLLLDFWPLRRPVEAGLWQSPILEKIPMLLLACISVAVTLDAQAAHFSSAGVEPPLATAAPGLLRYLGHMLWPAEPAIWHPPVLPPPTLIIAISVLVPLVATLLFWKLRRPFPWLIVGWLWCVLTLLPVLDLRDISMADRYTYLPSVGLSIMVVWSAAHLAGRWPVLRRPMSIAAAATIALFTFLSAGYVECWRDSDRLFRQALRVTPDNALAHQNLGVLYMQSGLIKEAEIHFRENLRLEPDSATAALNLGVVLARRHDPKGAEQQFQRSLELDPSLSDAHNNLGTLYYGQGKPRLAMLHYLHAIKIKPGFEQALTNLANLLLDERHVGEAAGLYSNALSINPGSPTTRYKLALCLALLGRNADTLSHLQFLSNAQPDVNWPEKFRGDLDAFAAAAPVAPPAKSGNPKPRHK